MLALAGDIINAGIIEVPMGIRWGTLSIKSVEASPEAGSLRRSSPAVLPRRLSHRGNI